MERVMLLPHRMNMRLSRNSSNQEPVELPLFNIIRWELTQRNSDCPEEGIRMVAVLRRKPWREVFTTYLPTMLLIMTTYVTTFFKSQFFEAALGANLTIMLLMTTIFMTSLSELTDTAYAKWIDVWLIFSQLVPFSVVLLLTLKEAYKDEQIDLGKTKRKRRKKTSQSIKPSSETTVLQSYEGETSITLVHNLAPEVVEETVPRYSRDPCKKPCKKLFYVKLIGRERVSRQGTPR